MGKEILGEGGVIGSAEYADVATVHSSHSPLQSIIKDVLTPCLFTPIERPMADVADTILGRLGLGSAASSTKRRSATSTSTSSGSKKKKTGAAAVAKGGKGKRGKKKDGMYGRGDETDFPELLPIATSGTT